MLPLDADFVHCGRGGDESAYLLAGIIRDSGSPISFHLFDNVEDSALSPSRGSANLDRTEDRDAAMRAQFVWPVERFMTAETSFRERAHVYPGQVPDRFPAVADLRFACVHIDVDLYQPTRDALEFFFPRMVNGGWMVVDDDHTASLPGSRAAVADFLAETKPRAVVAEQIGGVVIGC